MGYKGSNKKTVLKEVIPGTDNIKITNSLQLNPCN